MKIRDLQQYRRLISGNNLLDKLGSLDDPLLKELQGGGTDIHHHVGNVSSFAGGTNIQVFYELLQNASDAKADSFYVAFDEGNFLVINNGEPFITDGKIEEPGRLRSFLAKNKGAKYKNPEAIGEHGQGSKLLYDLLLSTSLEETEQTSKEGRLRKVIIEELKGLILFSWSSLPGLQRMCIWQGEPFEQMDCLSIEHPVLTKIIYTYYPASPFEDRMDTYGNHRVLFSQSEIQSFASFLNQAASKINTANFHKGTAIYLKPGYGRSEKLMEALDDNLLAGISTSLALLPHIKRVQINGHPVQKPTTFRKQKLQLSPEDSFGKEKSAWLYYPDHPGSFNGNISNFFKYFPVTNEIHGLKFIINTTEYKIDNSRQYIDHSDEHSEWALRKAGERIGEFIQELASSQNTTELRKIIQAVLQTDLSNPRGNPFIKEYFYERLIEIIKENIPTTAGIASLDDIEIVIKRSALGVTPSELGCPEMAWASEEMEPFYDLLEERLELPAWDIIDLLSGFKDYEHLKAWINALSEAEYSLLLTELSSHISNPEISSIEFLRFSNGEIFSLKEVNDSDELILIDDRIAKIKPILQKQKALLGGTELLDHPELLQTAKAKTLNDDRLFERLLSILDLSACDRDEKWAVFRTFRDQFELDQEALRQNLKLFQNKEGQHLPLSLLRKDTLQLAPSGILHAFQILPAEARFDEMDPYFMQSGEVWTAIREHWSMVLTNLNSDNYADALEDLEKLFQAGGPKNKLDFNAPWVLNDQGEIVTIEKCFFNENIPGLTPDEYQALSNILKAHTTFGVIHPEYYSTIGEVTFSKLPKCSLQELSNHMNQDAFTVGKRGVEVLHKCGLKDESFFRHFLIRKSGEGEFQISQKTKGIQYYSCDVLLNSFLAKQEGFSLLPEELLSAFQNDTSLKGELPDKEDAFANWLIDQFGANEAFIDLVQRRGQPVKHHYIQTRSRVDLTTDDPDDRYKEKFEGKFIGLMVIEGLEELGKAKIFIDGKPLTDFIYSENVKVKYDSKGATFKLSVLLPDFEGKSDAIEKIKEKLFGVKKGNLFSTQVYANEHIHQGIISANKIEKAEQLAFLVAYYQSEEGEKEYKNQFEQIDWQHIPKTSILDSFFREKISGFDEFLAGAFLIPQNHLKLDDPSLALPEERLPDWVLKWLNGLEDRHEEVQYLLNNGLQNEYSEVIRLRKALRANESVREETIKEAVFLKELCANTFKWFIEKLGDIVLADSENYKTLSKLIGFYAREHGVLPDFIARFYFGGALPEYKFKLIERASITDCCFLESRALDEIAILKQAEEKTGLTFIDTSHATYTNEFRQMLTRAGIPPAQLGRTFTPLESDKPKPWESKTYLEWKKEYPNYTILIAAEEIPFTYHLKLPDRDFEIGRFKKGQAALHREGNDYKIYIHLHDVTKESVLDIIKAHKSILFEHDQNPFIRLLELFSVGEQEKDLLEIIKEKALPREELLSRLNSPSSGDGGYNLGKDLTEEELDKLKSSIDDVNHLLKEVDSEFLKAIIGNLKIIAQLLESENEESTPNLLIGYIGEIMVFEWLKRKHQRTSTEIKHSSIRINEKGEIEPTYLPYDIELTHEGYNYLIDVKTTIKSVRDLEETVAFFIKKSQYKFIMDKQLDNYFIIRIGLADLNFEPFYWSLPKDEPFDQLIIKYSELILTEVKGFLDKEANVQKLERTRMAFKVVVPKLGAAPF